MCVRPNALDRQRSSSLCLSPRSSLPAEAEFNRDEGAAAASASRRSGFKYESISFEDSYGVTDEEYAGSRAGDGEEEGGGGKGGGRRAGKASYDVGGGDEEDDDWLADLAAKNKKRDKELWGGDDEEGGKGGKKGRKGKKGAAAESAKAGSADARGRVGTGGGGAGDPFHLGKGRSDTAESGREMEVDSIPIARLDRNDLKAVRGVCNWRWTVAVARVAGEGGLAAVSLACVHARTPTR